jgi:hypothetical protein
MQIDKSNYEIWLIDWLDGKLDDLQIHQLQSFLRDNPELSEEDEDPGIFMLKPPEETFQHKNHLKRTVANLTDSQFDYLSAAYLENDLIPDQIIELNEAISADRGKRSSFELMQKMKLIPAATTYAGKHRLRKRTTAGKIIRLSVIGLSAAAVVAIGLFIFTTVPAGYDGLEKTAAELKTVSPVVKEEAPGSNQIASKGMDNKQADISVPQPGVNESLPGQISKVTPDEKTAITVSKIVVPTKISLKKDAPATLIALNVTEIASVPDDGRSKVSRLIAKTFRDKILNEPAPEDRPLKAVEIAEAGVSGLNKILGWEMALSEKSSAEGKTEKIYFSSRILKINAPANKTDPEL